MTMHKVIVVEDERIVALHMKQQLMKLGYDVVAVAANGEKALRAINDLHPDVVLMDIHIEGDMDGIEVASRMVSGQTPVIYLSAYSEESTLIRARATKPYGYLVKPFSERELHATIQMALERHRGDLAVIAAERRLEKLNRQLQAEITERLRVEENLRASEERFRSIFGAVSEGIFIVDVTNGTIVEVNERGAAMYGYTPEEMIGLPIDAISSGEPPFTQDDAAAWMEKAAVSGQTQLFDWHGKRKDGSLLWAEVSMRLASIGGKNVALSIARDVTQRRAMEAQLRPN